MSKRIKWSLVAGAVGIALIAITIFFVSTNDSTTGYTAEKYREEVNLEIDDLVKRADEQIDQLNLGLLMNDVKLAETSAQSLSMYSRFVIEKMEKKQVPESAREHHKRFLDALSDMKSECSELARAYKNGDIFADAVPCTVEAVERIKKLRY
ncbi:MAG: photosystem II reaction center X protein [Bacillales bacterium]